MLVFCKIMLHSNGEETGDGAVMWQESTFVSQCGDNEVPPESTRHPHRPADVQT